MQPLPEGHVNQEISDQARKMRSVPDLLRKECLAALISLTAAGLLDALIAAPLEGPADPSGLASEHVKAPWIFVGIQQMLRYFPALLAGIIIPLGVFLALGLAPYAHNKPMFTRIVFFGIAGTVIVLTAWGYLA